jgi:hydrogenase small subunit
MKGPRDCTLSCQLSRRAFLQFCTFIAATLALPSSAASKIAGAIENKQKPYVVWLEFSDCAGDTEALLRATNPPVENILLDLISLEYHETIMAPAGIAAEKSLDDVVSRYRGRYLAIVEGAIPTADGGVYCCVSGRTALERVRRVCSNALAVIAAGSCASFGGVAAAAPNPTGAVGVKAAVPGANVINLPGCPVNPVNLTALLSIT